MELNWSGTSAKLKKGSKTMPAFSPSSDDSCNQYITIAAAAEWRPQFLSVCRSGCTQQGGFSTDACLQICNCMASEMEANFGNEALGSIDTPSVEQLYQTNEITMRCVRCALKHMENRQVLGRIFVGF
jgi:hypothetical protein